MHKIDLNTIVSKPNLSLGVISDTHNKINQELIGNLSSCDAIIHAGDIGDADVLNELSNITPHIYPVRGNNDIEDKWPSQDLDELEKIPEYLEIKFQNQIVGLIHGHQYDPVRKRHDKLRRHFSHADIVVYGHSHRYVLDQEEKPWVLNPGAGGYTRTFGGASVVVMNYENEVWSITPYKLEENKT